MALRIMGGYSKTNLNKDFEWDPMFKIILYHELSDISLMIV